MKYLAIGLALAAGLGLCAIQNSSQRNMATRHIDTYRGSAVYTMDIKGHEYILAEGSHACFVLHSESCPCKAARSQGM